MERLRFNLRRQLIVVSLLLLSLPWAGCQFIREMEGALGEAQEQALLATAETIAAMASERPTLIYTDLGRITDPGDSHQSVYAQPSLHAVVVDGYAEGWEDVPRAHWSASHAEDSLSVSLQALTHSENLYLLLHIEVEEVVYHNPGLSREPNGDRVILRTWQNGRRQDYALATAAPGSVRASAAGRRERGVDAEQIWGYWQDALGGYTLELEIPLELIGGRLGFYVIDSKTGNDSPVHTIGNTAPLDTHAPPWLIHTPDAVQAALSPFRAQADSVHLLDNAGWIVGGLQTSADAPRTRETFWLLRLVYRSILSNNALTQAPAIQASGKLADEEISHSLSGAVSSRRYQDPGNNNRALRVVSAPVLDGDAVIGAVVVSQSSEQYLSLTDQAFSRLLGYSALAIGLGAIGLLAYASLLSLRIGRLSKAASHVIGKNGVISSNFPSSNAPDEIGELSRRYAELLDRLREYNDYLRTLSRKLTHELRTPIAVIQTSLENLEETTASEHSPSPYLIRARAGLSRLNGILQAMSEASRLEESLVQNPLRPFDLVPLLRDMQGAYSAIYPDHPIELEVPEEPASVNAAADLIVQLLDKLVENAASFSPPGAPVRLSLQPSGQTWILAVSNQGPLLPEDIRSTLFEPMVSSRTTDDGQLHLGLGLHVVRLISDYLGADISAANTTEPPGVTITVTFPAE